MTITVHVSPIEGAFHKRAHCHNLLDRTVPCVSNVITEPTERLSALLQPTGRVRVTVSATWPSSCCGLAAPLGVGIHPYLASLFLSLRPASLASLQILPALSPSQMLWSLVRQGCSHTWFSGTDVATYGICH